MPGWLLLIHQIPPKLSDERRVELEAQLTRLQKKAAKIAAVDFFDSRGRETAGGLLAEIAERLAPPPRKPGKAPPAALRHVRRRVHASGRALHLRGAAGPLRDR